MVWLKLLLLTDLRITSNSAAYTDATLVNVFINSHIVNNTLIMKCFILKHWECADITLVFIEFAKSNSLLDFEFCLISSKRDFIHSFEQHQRYNSCIYGQCKMVKSILKAKTLLSGKERFSLKLAIEFFS